MRSLLLLVMSLVPLAAQERDAIPWTSGDAEDARPTVQIEGSALLRAALDAALPPLPGAAEALRAYRWVFTLRVSSDADARATVTTKETRGARPFRYDVAIPNRLAADVLAECARLQQPGPRSLPTPDRLARDVVGRPAPPLRVAGFVQGKPVSLEALRGKVVLVRFFTTTCPFCRSSLPAMQTLQDRHGKQGLVVLGVFHEKPRGRAVPTDELPPYLRRLGIRFPVALDDRWRTQRSWWLDRGARRKATSASFLLDRRGLVRHVHPGPELHPKGAPCTFDDPSRCDRAHQRMIQAIRALL